MAAYPLSLFFPPTHRARERLHGLLGSVRSPGVPLAEELTSCPVKLLVPLSSAVAVRAAGPRVFETYALDGPT